MIQVYEYNHQNELVRPIEVFERDEEGNYVIPEQCTTIAPPNNPSFYKAAFDPEKKEWFESASKEYIESMQPVPDPPSDIDLLKQQNAVLTKQLTEISKEATAAKLREAQMAKQLAQLMTEKLKGGEKS